MYFGAMWDLRLHGSYTDSEDLGCPSKERFNSGEALLRNFGVKASSEDTGIALRVIAQSLNSALDLTTVDESLEVSNR